MDEAKLIRELRIEYVDSAIDGIEELTNEITDLDQNFSKELHRNIARKIHSLKGTSGSFGLYEVSSLAHVFEEHFNHLDKKIDDVDLLYNILDDIALILKEYTKNISDAELKEALEKIMKQSRAKTNPEKINILLADSTKVIASGIQRICQDQAIVSKSSDGLQALSRMITENFDVVIVSKHLSKLNGLSCIAAIKSEFAHEPDRIPYFVLITTEVVDTKGENAPDKVIIKDDNFYNEISNVVTEYRKNKK